MRCIQIYIYISRFNARRTHNARHSSRTFASERVSVWIWLTVWNKLLLYIQVCAQFHRMCLILAKDTHLSNSSHTKSIKERIHETQFSFSFLIYSKMYSPATFQLPKDIFNIINSCSIWICCMHIQDQRICIAVAQKQTCWFNQQLSPYCSTCPLTSALTPDTC